MPFEIHGSMPLPIGHYTDYGMRDGVLTEKVGISTDGKVMVSSVCSARALEQVGEITG